MRPVRRKHNGCVLLKPRIYSLLQAVVARIYRTATSFTIIGLLSLATYTRQNYCTKSTGTPNPNDPPLPKLPQQYQTKIEANIYDKGKTVTGYEYFDHAGDRAMLGMLDSGSLHKLIFDYANDQLFYVTGLGCKITSLLVDDNNLLFGNNFTGKGIPHVFTSGGALHFAASFGEKYMGVTQVRGITVDHWQSCLYWGPMLSNFTLDYYFTVKNWSDPINYPQIPVRALAVGVQMQDDGHLRNFTHYYDYMDFQPLISDYTVFETPEGVLCTGRNKTKPLPFTQSIQNYHYKAEIVDVMAGKVSYREVWYDGQRNYTRKDYRPVGRGDPVAEIHDFNFGTKYIIDQVTGACQVTTLNGTDSDTDLIKYRNGTTRLAMTSLKHFLFLDDSYAYTGQRLARGILCDVYSGEKTNFLKKSGTNATAVIDFFFLADGMKVYGDSQVDKRPNVPIQVIATIDALGFKITYQFMDVGELEPRYSKFDVSACYPKSSVIEFMVKLRGDPQKSLLEQIQWHAQEQVAIKMGVSFIRVQEADLDYDSAFVYLSAKLLPPLITQPGIVAGPMPAQLSSADAFANLQKAVYAGDLTTIAYQPYFSAGITYKAVDISVKYGLLRPQPTPILSDQMSYGLENSVPNAGIVFNTHIWYDYEYKLVRYDTYNGAPTSTIHDYNSGLAYIIDKASGRCQVSRITNTSFDVVGPSQSQAKQNGYMLRLRNPLQFLDLTNGYVYIGQKTIRGIMCDVYENVANFSFGGVSKPAVYQFYFMSVGWHELSIDSGVSVQSQPVSMVVTPQSQTDYDETEHFDFYDFSEQKPDLSSFNIEPCFTGNQRQLFMIRFNQSYHPYLDQHKEDFIKLVQRKLSILTQVSPLRFQDAQVTNNKKLTFYFATIVQQAPDILDFTKTSNSAGLYSSDGTYVNVRSADDCAGYCRNITAFTCESFDYCSYKGLCQLSKLHTEDGHKVQSSAQCDHYSRTVNSHDKAEPTNKQAMVMLQDIISRTGFNIVFNVTKTASVMYPAVNLAPNLVKFDNNKAGSETLSHFRVKPMSSVDQHAMVQEGLFSIDDCAKKCLSTKSFTCDSFTYCSLAGECILSNIHPDVNVSDVTYSLACDLYIRKYTDKYNKYEGRTTQVQPDKTLHAVPSADICAKDCIMDNQIQCRSFDYCANTQTCYLKTKHILEFSSTNVTTSTDCSHYSKKYLYDFAMTPNHVVSDGKTVGHILFYNISVENCARLCVQNYGYACKGLSYCSTALQCIAYSSDLPLVSAQTSKNNNCHLYSRQYFDDSRPRGPVSNPSAQSGSTGYSAGSMGGVAIAMLCVGVLLGATLLYFFRTKQLVERKEEQEMQNVHPSS